MAGRTQPVRPDLERGAAPPRRRSEPSAPKSIVSSQSSTAVVELDQVDFAYQPGARRILSGLCMRVPKGSVVAVMGGSGCGKTTVLRLIGGQVAAASGAVRVHGADIGAMDKPALYAARRQMGMLFQFGALFSDMSVFDNVAFAARAHRTA